MEVLWNCLLRATELDLELEAEWIPTKANAQADALSRLDKDKITNLPPQLIYPECNLQKSGWRTYGSQDSHPSRDTSSGVAFHLP